jgi:hypothetical protein
VGVGMGWAATLRFYGYANTVSTTDLSDVYERANNRRSLRPASLQPLFCDRSGQHLGLWGQDPPPRP